jgi:two-component system OmpR family response regulator
MIAYPKQSGNEADLEGLADAPDAPRSRPKLRSGDIEIDCDQRKASVAGAPLDLTGGEFALLLHFVVRANRLVTRPELLANVWSMPWHSGSNVVDVVVCRLRRRLGAHGRMIETVRGLGYRFRAPDRGQSAGVPRRVEAGPHEAPAERL